VTIVYLKKHIGTSMDTRDNIVQVLDIMQKLNSKDIVLPINAQGAWDDTEDYKTPKGSGIYVRKMKRAQRSYIIKELVT
jgi:hypothetical protein